MNNRVGDVMIWGLGILVLVLITTMISGCAGVDGELLEIDLVGDGAQILDEGYRMGFFDGCMISLASFSTDASIPPFEVAQQACEALKNSMDGAPRPFFDLPAEPIEPIICTGNCI